MTFFLLLMALVCFQLWCVLSFVHAEPRSWWRALPYAAIAIGFGVVALGWL